MFLTRRPRAKAVNAAHRVKQLDTAAQPAPGRRARRASLRYLPLMTLLLAIWACGGTAVVAVTHKPASQLRIALDIAGQYSNRPTVQIGVEIYDLVNQQSFALAKSARLTCNGSDIVPTIQSGTHTCPRQPPGGAYHIEYTDEHGVSTTVTVPIPTGVFALLSPQPGALVPIPTIGALSVRFSIPHLVAPASVTDGSIDASCGDVQYSCGLETSGPFDNPIATPSVANGSGTAVATSNALTCPPSPLPKNLHATMHGDQVTYILSDDFTSFQPGPGSIDLWIAMCMSPNPAGFAAARVTFSDSISAPITWVR